MNKKKILTLVLSFIVVYFVAFLGSIFTSKSVKSEWYESIKPALTPPNWVFPVVWNILFFLIAISLFLSWTNAKLKDKKTIAFAFGANFILNILWSIFYFGMQNPKVAFFDIILLWLSIAFMIFTARKASKTAGWLLVPYLLWVSFASILNWMSI